MNRPSMSASGTALLRALFARQPLDTHRILLSNICSTDWQSLTFDGERHQLGFVVRGPDAMALAERWTDGLPDAELDVGRGRFVADIAVRGDLQRRDDDSVLVEIEALTLCD